MIDNYFDDEKYSKVDFSQKQIKKGEYDNCIFENCNFESVHASNIQFVECEFINCNFSNTVVKNSAFKDVQFVNCKLIGVKFNECDVFLLQMNFNNCQLNFSSFYQLKMPKTTFDHCNLEEADFTETELQEAVFDDCSLKNAIFDRTNLEKTDFRTAKQFCINPTENRLKGAKFSKSNVIGLLQKYQIVIE